MAAGLELPVLGWRRSFTVKLDGFSALVSVQLANIGTYAKWLHMS